MSILRQRTKKMPELGQDDPDLVIFYLQYALADVRRLSERSAEHLERAIATLSEDTEIVAVSATPRGIRRSS
jgi:hypothetical protein